MMMGKAMGHHPLPEPMHSQRCNIFLNCLYIRFVSLIFDSGVGAVAALSFPMRRVAGSSPVLRMSHIFEHQDVFPLFVIWNIYLDSIMYLFFRSSKTPAVTPMWSYHTSSQPRPHIGQSIHAIEPAPVRPLTESSIPSWRTVRRCFYQEFLRAPARPRPSLVDLPWCAIIIMAINCLPQPLTLAISSWPS